MAGQHVQEQVESGARPRGFHEHACGVDDLGCQRKQAEQSRNVLEEDDEAKRFLRVQRRGVGSQTGNHHPDQDLHPSPGLSVTKSIPLINRFCSKLFHSIKKRHSLAGQTTTK